MRVMTAAMTTAAQIQGSAPDLKLELADVWPHFATVVTSVNGGPCAAVVVPDGSVVAAYVSIGVPNTVYVQRVTDSTSAGQWTTWTSITTDGRAQAGLCLCVAGSTTRLLWQSSATTAVWYADSADSGQSWSTPTSLFDPGKALYGIAADGDLTYVLIAYLNSGSFARLAAWHFSGVWSGVDWTNGDLNTITGLAATRNGNGSYGVALTLQGATGEAYSVQNCLYTPGGAPVWTALALIAPVDTSAGLLVLYPHLTQFDGGYRLTYQIADTGSVSGIAYMRVARLSSFDFTHWQAGVEDQLSFPSGATWLKHATSTLLVAAEAVRRAPLYSAVTGYRDCTGDIITLDLHEQEGAPAHLTVTLDNSTGAYSALTPLLTNAQLLLSHGFVGAGLLPTHLLYVDEWTFTRAADAQEVTISAEDRTRFLTRQARAPLSYNNQTIGYIGTDLAIKGGFDGVSIDAGSQFSQLVPLFQVQAGRSYLESLIRLLGIYDGFHLARTIPGTGVAFAVVDRLRLAQKNVTDTPVWTYNGEPEHLHVTHAGDRANRLSVFGPQKTPTALAEALDWGDIIATGQERPAVLVEQYAVNAAAAQLSAALALAREQRLATRVELAVQPHPGLELLDVLTINDTALPSVYCRIVAAQLSYYPLEGLHDLVLTGEGL